MQLYRQKIFNNLWHCLHQIIKKINPLLKIKNNHHVFMKKLKLKNKMCMEKENSKGKI